MAELIISVSRQRHENRQTDGQKHVAIDVRHRGFNDDVITNGKLYDYE